MHNSTVEYLDQTQENVMKFSSAMWAVLFFSFALPGCAENGESGDAAGDATAVLPDTTVADLTPSQIEELMLKFHACDLDNVRYPPRIPKALVLFPHFTSCALAANSCADLVTCIGFDLGKPCDPDTSNKTCDNGSILTICGNSKNGRFVWALDCAKESNGNNTCETKPGMFIRCRSEKCQGTEGHGCFEDSSGGCANGKQTNCPAGTTCRFLTSSIAGEGGSVWCEKTSNETCDISPSSWCDGTILKECNGGNFVEEVDCTSFDPRLTCKLVAEDTLATLSRCVPTTEPECDFYGTKGFSICEGNTLRLCRYDLFFDFDCSSVFNATCEGNRCVAPDSF